jgi:hypothetical protein
MVHIDSKIIIESMGVDYDNQLIFFFLKMKKYVSMI